MPHVDAPRRIGKHLKHIGAGLCRAVVCDEGAVFFPHALPAGVGSLGIETGVQGTVLGWWIVRGRRAAGRGPWRGSLPTAAGRSEEHTSEHQSLMRNSYVALGVKKKKQHT